jgi:hypothetical protein
MVASDVVEISSRHENGLSTFPTRATVLESLWVRRESELGEALSSSLLLFHAETDLGGIAFSN